MKNMFVLLASALVAATPVAFAADANQDSSQPAVQAAQPSDNGLQQLAANDSQAQPADASATQTDNNNAADAQQQPQAKKSVHHRRVASHHRNHAKSASLASADQTANQAPADQQANQQAPADQTSAN